MLKKLFIKLLIDECGKNINKDGEELNDENILKHSLDILCQNDETESNNEKNIHNNKFKCYKCNYFTNKKSSFDYHMSSDKHNKGKIKKQIKKTFDCKCGYVCNSRTTLWRHSKKCGKDEKNTKKTLEKLTLCVENISNILSNGQTNYINNGIVNITNVNKSFNLNMFLNETCKDAMNITDFVDSIKVTNDDLEYTGKNGYVEGISNIFLKNLQNVEKHIRPLHCGDSKRDVFYIKHNNEWIKEKDDKPILTNAIKQIAKKNISQITEWTKQYPNCKNHHDKHNNCYLYIVMNSMDGECAEESALNVSKIIKKLSKETIIHKMIEN